MRNDESKDESSADAAAGRRWRRGPAWPARPGVVRVGRRTAPLMGMLFIGVVLGFAFANYASERDAWAAEESPAMSASASDVGVGGQGMTVYPPDVSLPAPVSVGAAQPAVPSVGIDGERGATQTGPVLAASAPAGSRAAASSVTPAVSAGWWWLVAVVLCALAGSWWWAARRRLTAAEVAPNEDAPDRDAAAVVRRYLPMAAEHDPLETWAAGTGGAVSTTVSAPRDDQSVQPPCVPDEPSPSAPAEESAHAAGAAPHPEPPATDEAVRDAVRKPPAQSSAGSTLAAQDQVWGAATEDSSYTVLWRRPA